MSQLLFSLTSLLLVSMVIGKLDKQTLELDYDAGMDLVSLPLTCYNQEFPYKDGYVVSGAEQLRVNKANHPVFYGCFDWHSSVHGHWVLATMARRFPGTELAQNVTLVFNEQFTDAKIAREVKLFNSHLHYERPYGWAWFLKLQQELLELSKIPKHELAGHASTWSQTLQPLADHLVEKYKAFLPKLLYPVRSGQHSNTAFGLAFAFEYAQYTGDEKLVELIRNNSTGHFGDDASCPLSWEPSGSDFLSPCLQEADLVSRMFSEDVEFVQWLESFLPQIFENDFCLAPGRVKDETDGKLVHLHGVNFARGWNFYSLVIRLVDAMKHASNPEAESEKLKMVKDRLMDVGDRQVRAALDQVVSSHYMGSHWLASFLTHALQKREEAMAKAI